MHSAEYYAYLKKMEEYLLAAREEPDLRVKEALEAVAQACLRHAESLKSKDV
jgi:hypothetical protein